jgi:integrase
VLWRAGLRICEALALAEADLDARRGSLLVRRGKGGRRREVGIDDWAWEQLAPWLDVRVELPGGPLFPSSIAPRADGPGRPPPSAPSSDASPARPGVRRRFAPHQLRHAHAVEMAREGVPLIVIQRQLGHTNRRQDRLGIAQPAHGLARREVPDRHGPGDPARREPLTSG